MLRNFTLEYSKDGAWFVGKLREVPGVFSQGKTISELEENVRDAYQMMMGEVSSDPVAEVSTRVLVSCHPCDIAMNVNPPATGSREVHRHLKVDTTLAIEV